MESLNLIVEARGGVLIWSLPGVFEELFFQGVLGLLLPRGSRPVRRSRVVFAVVMQGLAFGLFHLPGRWVITGMLGMLFGVMAVRSRSVWPGVVAICSTTFWSCSSSSLWRRACRADLLDGVAHAARCTGTAVGSSRPE